MPELKKLSKDAIPNALEKAERYRLLNEPAEAESICLDILAAEPENQPALITLLLAVTDRFSKTYGVSDTQAKEILTRIRGTPGCTHLAYEGFREAMQWFEKAEVIRPAGNDDALLRWNTCARLIEKNQLSAREEDRSEPVLE
jgi:hypothetical protein